MYQYGLEILISGLIGIINILIISILIHRLTQGIVFLIVFIVLREYTGGYHAESYISFNYSGIKQ
jgi:accessory gene regulator B